MANIDQATVDGFGREWDAYDQSGMAGEELVAAFNAYFSIFPFDRLPADAEGFDLGCGSGRWAAMIQPKVGRLHCIDPAPAALAVAQRRLGTYANVALHLAGVDDIPLADGSQDFGYSLGVLHHIPDTAAALKACVAKLKPGAPFLLYLYYALETRPAWYRGLWRVTDGLRRGIARLPFPARKAVTAGIAAGVYWPLARAAKLIERSGGNAGGVPLAVYRNCSFYTMRTDALDRFGTRLEQRFTRAQIEAMMREAGLGSIRFSDSAPYWVACGYKAG